jgi:hypothetical protein
VFPQPAESLSSYSAAPPELARGAQLLRMDRLCGLSLCAADEALLAAAAVGRWRPESTAILIGSAYGCHKTDEEFLRSVFTGQPSPRLFAYTLPSSPIGEVSIQHRLTGPGSSIVSGRTAAIEALAEACALLLSSQAAACLVLGCDVASPALPVRDEDADLCDGAVAVLLVAEDEECAGAGNGYLVAASSRYVCDDPAAALAAVASEVLQLQAGDSAPILICDPQTAKYCPRTLGSMQVPVQVKDTPRCGAAAALSVFAGLPALASQSKDGASRYLVLSADPCGLAAAALWQRTRSATSRTAP